MQVARRRSAPRARKTASAIEAAIDAAYEADNAEVAARLKMIIEKLTGAHEDARWLASEVTPRAGNRVAG